MSVMSEEREDSSAGCPMSTAEVPSSCENTYVFDYSKVECGEVRWGEQACHCSDLAPGEISTEKKRLTIVLGWFCECSGQ